MDLPSISDHKEVHLQAPILDLEGVSVRAALWIGRRDDGPGLRRGGFSLWGCVGD